MSRREGESTNPNRTVITRTDRGAKPDSGPQSACLVIIYGAEIGRRIELGQAVLTIGRSSRCDLQLDEESVSRNHARIEPIAGGQYQVSDLGSTNGLYVNDVPHKNATLHHGDQIQIGRSILKFLAGGHIESAYHEEIYRLMTTDGLTQLMNRRSFEEALAREIARATRHARPVCVCILDIDRFKSVNDNYGHLAGDAILRQLGAILRANLRRDDLAGRMGGEEFGIILPEVDTEGGVIAAEKVRRLVETHRFEFDGTRIPITVSVGVTAKSEHDGDAVEIIRRADEHLYEAKRGGRNCVRH